jgi:hypothetical protein
MATSSSNKPTLYMIGCSWMTYTILEELATRDTLPYGKILLYDSRPTTHLERTRLTKWHPILDASTTPPKEEKAPRFTMSQLCKSTFTQFRSGVSVDILENFVAEFPANKVIHDKVVVYTEIGVVSLALMKRVEEQIDSPQHIYYLFQNGLFGIFKHGYVWKYKYQKTYRITPQTYELTKEGCAIYIDYLRMIKHHKDDIYVLPERFYRYKLMTQCFPLGTIMAMMFLTDKFEHAEYPEYKEQWIQYPTVFDYSSLYGDTIIELPTIKNDTHAIFNRELQTILRERVHWIQSVDPGSEMLIRDLLMYLQWVGIHPGRSKATKIYLVSNDDIEKADDGRPLFVPEDYSVLQPVADMNEYTKKGYLIRNADWIWRLDTHESSKEKNAYLHRHIYDYRKNTVALSQTNATTAVNIAIPRHFTLPHSSVSTSISLLEKRMMLAFGFMNWIQLTINSLYMDQYARSYSLSGSTFTLECPEEPRRITYSDEMPTVPYEFTEWYRWKAEYVKDGCDTVRHLIEYIQDTYEVYPIKIQYETDDGAIIYERASTPNSDEEKTQADMDLVAWIRQYDPKRRECKGVDLFRLVLTCNTADNHLVKVPPLYFSYP